VPYDAREVANFFLDYADSREVPLTHLGLQKILYFAHAWYLAKYNVPLIGHKFEAWEYGPVIRVVFDQLKFLNRRKIDVRLKKIDPFTGAPFDAKYDFNDNTKVFLKNIFDYYGRIDPRALVDLTHEAGGAWEKVWKSTSQRSVVGMYIPDEAIKLWILRDGGREGMIRH
jgi:uncharacterized phage-associated protein